MKCPSGKHDYCPEEDSVITFKPKFKQECSKCVVEERDKLQEDVQKMRRALEYVEPILAVIGKLGQCAQGGEQTGNQLHVWEAQKIVKHALK